MNQEKTKWVYDMSRYLADERRTRLAQLINDKGSFRVAELAEYFGVTKETIRKDLIYLDQQKLVCKTHGGAVSISESTERPIHMRSTENPEKKMRIAEKALDFLSDSKVVILDSGSTVMQLASLIMPGQCETLITNSLPAANALAGKEMPFLWIGGEFSPITMSTSGMAAAQTLSYITADVVFLGSSGFQSCGGPSAKAFCEAQIKREMMKKSRTKIVMADSSKFVTNAFVRFADWSEIDYLITDTDAPKEVLAELMKKVNVTLV